MSETPPEGSVRVVWPDDPLWPQGGYANNFVVNHTPWDFTIRFGHLVTPAVLPGTMVSEGVEVAVSPVAQVTMPPPALLQLVLVLQAQVAQYNANYGAIGGAPPDQGIS